MNDGPAKVRRTGVIELMPPDAAPLRRQVEDALRAAIMAGHFSPGERLRERELLELFPVSRTSLREALRQIEAEGLVTLEPNRGAVVATLSENDVEEIYEARAVLEGQACAGFAERASDAQIAEMQRLFALMREAARAQDASRVIDLKTDIYRVILEGCGNSIVRQMLGLLHNRIWLMRGAFISSLSKPQRMPEPIGELRDVVEAIAARDGKAARAASEHHVREAARATLRAMRAMGRDEQVAKPRERRSAPKRAG